MNRVINQNVNEAVEDLQNEDFDKVVEFLKSCEYRQLVEFGYQVEDNNIDIQNILKKSDLADGTRSIYVVDVLDGIKSENSYRVKVSWSGMNDSETLALGVCIRRCDLSLDDFFEMINS